MSEQIKLRECPFCGGEPFLDIQYFSNICCSNCDFALNVDNCDIDIVIKKWNTRTEDKRIEKALEEIEVLIKRCEYNLQDRPLAPMSPSIMVNWFEKIQSILKGETDV